MYKLYLFIVVWFTPFLVSGQSAFDHWLKKTDKKIEPFIMVQLWGNYTFNQEVFNEELGRYEAVDDRWNVLLRRARLGFRAQPYNNLKFTLVGAYDLIGRDLLSGISGGANNGSLPKFGIWDAFFQWKIKKNTDAFNLVGGYFRPQFSRESITSGWSVNSMEKAMSQTYIRKHLVGSGPGRAMGLNLGGLIWKEGQTIGLNYNVGIFNPVSLTLNGNSVGSEFAPLLVARAVLHFGDPEMTNYKIGYNINYFNQRKGLSLGGSLSRQGRTEIFHSSMAAQLDVLLNWGPLNLDGEWIWMQRENTSESFDYANQTGHIRLGYNLILANKYFLEPSFMLMAYQGGMSKAEQSQAAIVGSSAGEERTYDLGLNWYLDQKNLKLMVHYTWRTGDPGTAEAGSKVNAYFSQSGLAIRRGNWLGLGLHAIF